jgi:hypothetical protein
VSELWRLVLVLRDLVVGDSLDPSLLHVLLHGVLSTFDRKKFVIKALLRDVKEEEVEACKLGNVLLYGLVASIVSPLEIGVSIRLTSVRSTETRAAFRSGVSNEVNKPFIFSAHFVNQR